MLFSQQNNSLIFSDTVISSLFEEYDIEQAEPVITYEQKWEKIDNFIEEYIDQLPMAQGKINAELEATKEYYQGLGEINDYYNHITDQQIIDDIYADVNAAIQNIVGSDGDFAAWIENAANIIDQNYNSTTTGTSFVALQDVIIDALNGMDGDNIFVEPEPEDDGIIVVSPIEPDVDEKTAVINFLKEHAEEYMPLVQEKIESELDRSISQKDYLGRSEEEISTIVYDSAYSFTQAALENAGFSDDFDLKGWVESADDIIDNETADLIHIKNTLEGAQHMIAEEFSPLIIMPIVYDDNGALIW